MQFGQMKNVSLLSNYHLKYWGRKFNSPTPHNIAYLNIIRGIKELKEEQSNPLLITKLLYTRKDYYNGRIYYLCSN